MKTSRSLLFYCFFLVFFAVAEASDGRHLIVRDGIGGIIGGQNTTTGTTTTTTTSNTATTTTTTSQTSTTSTTSTTSSTTSTTSTTQTSNTDTSQTQNTNTQTSQTTSTDTGAGQPPPTTNTGSSTVTPPASQTNSSAPSQTTSADNSGNNTSSGLGTGSIIGLSVAGGVAVLGIVGFFVWKLTRKRFGDFDDNEAIKWPELNTHSGTESHPLPVHNTGRAGFDTGSELSLSRAPSEAAGTYSDYASSDPYAVPALPHLNPNQPYRDDPSGTYYDPYRGPVPNTLDQSADWHQNGPEAIPMTQMGRTSPGPGMAYDVGGRSTPVGIAGRASPGPAAAYGAGRASPGPQMAYGRSSPGPNAAYDTYGQR